MLWQSRCRGWVSPDAPSTVDDEVVTIDEARAGGCEEYRCSDVIVGLAVAGYGCLVGKVLPDCGVFVARVGVPGDHAGAEGVDGDAARTELAGEVVGEADEAVFRCGVCTGAGIGASVTRILADGAVDG